MSWSSDRINALEHQLRAVTNERDELKLQNDKAARLVLAALHCIKSGKPEAAANLVDALFFALARLTGHSVEWLHLLVEIPPRK